MRRIVSVLVAAGAILLALDSPSHGDRPSALKKKVVHKDASGQWTLPDRTITLDGLMTAYGLSPDDPGKLGRWLDKALKQAGQTSHTVSLDWTESKLDANERTYWEAHGTLNGEPRSFWLNVSSGDLTITTDQGLEGMTLSYQIVVPYMERPNLPFNPSSTRVLALGCHCSNSGGSCTAQQCENGDWCHSNGNSCENGAVATIVEETP